MKLEEIFTLCSCKCGILSSFNKKKTKQRKLLKYVLINAKGRGHALWRSTFTLRYFSISPLDIFRNMYMKVTEPIMKRKKKLCPHEIQCMIPEVNRVHGIEWRIEGSQGNEGQGRAPLYCAVSTEMSLPLMAMAAPV